MLYGNENVVETLSTLKYILSDFGNVDKIYSVIKDTFEDDCENDKIKSIRAMLFEYRDKPELREGVDLALISLTGYCMDTLLNKAEHYMETSDEEDKALDKFFEKSQAFVLLEGADPVEDEGNYTDLYLHQNFKEAKEIANKPGIFTYTVVDGDDGYTAWISEGWHLVNRQGYIFTTEKIDIPDKGVRYW